MIMKKNCCKSSIKGFTLIELLVVVLIIGILAAIALPQYQKAVRKARLSEVMVRAKTLMNGIDLYLLTNGGVPSTGSTITFLGDANATLDVELSWDSADGKYSYTKLGKWAAACSDGSSCTIQFRSAYHGDQTEGNNWLDGAELELDKNGESSPWILGYTDNKVICDWWKQNFGSSRIYSGTCNE